MSLPALAAEPEPETDTQEIVVVASRSRQLVRDQPTRVEVVPEEELEESQTVAPGNLSNLLNELAGARMSVTAPGLGGTSMSLRGMPGRHSQILFDGLPLSGAQSDSFSMLQSPPLDLRRVEVIKGAASALYGGSALSGVLNLVSKPPGSESELLLNQTSDGGSDANIFLASANNRASGYTFTGGLSQQGRKDFDHDGWGEIPGYRRVSLRSRGFWQETDARSLFATIGIMGEDRTGGTTGENVVPAGIPFPQALRTRRYDAGLLARGTAQGGGAWDGKLSVSYAHHDRQFGTVDEDDAESNVDGEFSYQQSTNGHEWTVGTAIQYQQLDFDAVPGIGFNFTIPAVFAQDEFKPRDWLAISASARLDVHSEFGSFVSPRLSMLFKLGPEWSLRVATGSGFSAPTPLIEDVQATALSLLVKPVKSLRAERAVSSSIDLKWGHKPFDANVSVFGANIRNFLSAEKAPDPTLIQLVNLPDDYRVTGAELLLGLTRGPAHILINTTYLDASESDTSGERRAVELIPRLTAEIAAIFEDEDRGRVGFEVSYTGDQPLHDDPYRTRAPSFVELNALGQLKLGEWAVFLNVLNVTDRKQSEFDPLLRPAPLPGLGGTPTTDAWGPQSGRVFNLGVRVEL